VVVREEVIFIENYKDKKKKCECELVNPSFTIKPGICFTEVTVSC